MNAPREVSLDGLVAFVATTDLARAREFYADKLGLPLSSENPQALVFNSGQTPLRVTLVQEVALAPYTVLGWTVEDIRSAVLGLTSSGVEFQRFGGAIEQGEAGIWTAPSGDSVAWFKDPDGNLLSLTQPAQM